MESTTDRALVGLVIVSHSASIADGVAELVAQVAGEDVAIVSAGGGPDGTLGTDGNRVRDALRAADTGAGAVVLVDLGSAVLSARAALADLDGEANVVLADAPLVEGAVSAAVAASTGLPLADVVAAAEEARSVRKL
jgi:phosphoenolpyruvate---glycerone phosphotransferase subunit DhaM